MGTSTHMCTYTDIHKTWTMPENNTPRYSLTSTYSTHQHMYTQTETSYTMHTHTYLQKKFIVREISNQFVYFYLIFKLEF